MSRSYPISDSAGKLATPRTLQERLTAIRSKLPASGRVAFVCIGTDCSTGDAFGPLTGSRLMEAGFDRVIGTLASTCDSDNLSERLQELGGDTDMLVIGIDASLGSRMDVGSFRIAAQPVYPGRSLGKMLPPVGSISITGIVNENRGNNYSVLQSTSLFRVMQMADQLAGALRAVFLP